MRTARSEKNPNRKKGLFEIAGSAYEKALNIEPDNKKAVRKTKVNTTVEFCNTHVSVLVNTPWPIGRYVLNVEPGHHPTTLNDGRELHVGVPEEASSVRMVAALFSGHLSSTSWPAKSRQVRHVLLLRSPRQRTRP